MGMCASGGVVVSFIIVFSPGFFYFLIVFFHGRSPVALASGFRNEVGMSSKEQGRNKTKEGTQARNNLLTPAPGVLCVVFVVFVVWWYWDWY